MKIETKYNIGDEVWVMHEGSIRKTRIRSIKIYYSKLYGTSEEYGLKLRDNYRFRVVTKESRMFPSKEELINSL